MCIFTWRKINLEMSELKLSEPRRTVLLWGLADPRGFPGVQTPPTEAPGADLRELRGKSASSRPWQSRELSEAHTALWWSFCRLSTLANTHWDVLVPRRTLSQPL